MRSTAAASHPVPRPSVLHRAWKDPRLRSYRSVQVGQYASALRDRLSGFTKVQLFGEVFGFKAGRAKVWFELSDAAGAIPCSMWREDFDKLKLGRSPTARRSWSPAGATTTPARGPLRRASASR